MNMTNQTFLEKEKLMSNVFLWTSMYGEASIGLIARNYIYPFCVDMGYRLEDFLGASVDKDERKRENPGTPCYQRGFMMMMMMMIL